nr:hypothetical protein HK105_000382 [Polyrhizophydium stewartii]
MLGGFGFLTDTDARGSLDFIAEFIDNGQLATATACDCGAGIGRVTDTFLLKKFEKVDLVEQNSAFLETAKTAFTERGQAHRIGEYYAVGLQDFVPEEGKYDLIWCQWVLGHLTDDDFVAFFKRCKLGLKPGGFIGVKENLTKNGIIVDEEDSSCTRDERTLKRLLAQAGLTIVKESLQKGFPKELYAVKMHVERRASGI